MPLDSKVLNSLTKGSAEEAWRVIINNAVEIASKPLSAHNASSEVLKRDREIGTLDHFLSSVGTCGRPLGTPSSAPRIDWLAGGLNPTAPRRY